MNDRRTPDLLDWGAAEQPFPGEGVSGDRYSVVPRGKGVLVAVIDALGHGAAAEATARKTSGILEQHAHEPLPVLIERCHNALLSDRGVVMSVATIDGARGKLELVGVGNVAALLLRSSGGAGMPEHLVQPAGIVGVRLPELRVRVARLSPGDLLLFATDGIREGFGEHLPPMDDDPQRLAERLVLDNATHADDALVLVVRYLGAA